MYRNCASLVTLGHWSFSKCAKDHLIRNPTLFHYVWDWTVYSLTHWQVLYISALPQHYILYIVHIITVFSQYVWSYFPQWTEDFTTFQQGLAKYRMYWISEHNGIASTEPLPKLINCIEYPLWRRAVSHVNQIYSDLLWLHFKDFGWRIWVLVDIIDLLQRHTYDPFPLY